MTTTNLPALRVPEQVALARELANSELLPAQYRRNPSNLMWAIQYAEALGVHPMTAITGIHVIEGKPTASAQLIGGLVRRAGHILRVSMSGSGNGLTARASIYRADDPEFEFVSEWTMKRASDAGLTGKKVWRQYPDAMLKARAVTEVARDACPEALYGVIYTPEEVGGNVEVAPDGEMVVVEGSETELPIIDGNTAKYRLIDAAGGNVDIARTVWGDRGNLGVTPDELAELVAEAEAQAGQVDAEVIEDDADTDAEAEVEVELGEVA